MKLLLIEDEVALSDAIAEGLVLEGFAVKACYDGKSGLKEAIKNSFDVIILDILLPELNGYEVCKAIRAAGISTPILILTAKAGEYDITDAFELGADDYVAKPFSVLVLHARLRALQRRTQNIPIEELRLGALILNPVTRECSQKGEPVFLTAREAAVLELLLLAKNYTVSKKQLAKKIWGNSEETNLVEIYIGYLRKKLDHPFDLSTIHTIRNLGYYLSA